MKTPSYIRLTALSVLSVFLILEIYKVVFYLYFGQIFENVSSEELIKAWGISTRFDVRLSVLLCAPIGLIAMMSTRRFFSSKIFERINKWYFTVVCSLLVLMLLGDMGNFAYTSERLNASLLEFAKNPMISLSMLWQTYPVIWGALFLLVVGAGFYFVFGWIYKISAKASLQHEGIVKKILLRVLSVLICAWGVYGSTSHYPLRWSEAFFSKDKNANSLALNPILFFYDSLNSAEPAFDQEEYQKYLPVMARFLGSEAGNPFEREVKADSSARKPNVVFVMLESLGAGSMSAYGNPMPSTPLTDSLLKKSLWFKNAYVPRAGTAFSVYGSTVGIPDVIQPTTASRIPQAIDQRILMDQFDAYQRYYIIGGSANWANIRAIFQGNVEGVKVYEEGTYQIEQRADVWGIDDYDVFKYASDIFDSLNRAGKPFVAYVQSASNHRPYTVPDQKEEFRPLKESEVDMSMLSKAGFLELGQYNALRYLDFNIDRFIRRAKEQGWADNTLFVFFGDHNMSMNPYSHTPKPEFSAGLSVSHVPIFIYSPRLVQSKQIETPISLIDVFPTAMSVAGLGYTNYTLGRDMSKPIEGENYSFVFQLVDGQWGLWLVGDTLLYKTSLKSPDKYSVWSYKDSQAIEEIDIPKEKQMYLDSLARAFYHSSKYLYLNNKKR